MGIYSTPSLADLDGDGDLDAVIGEDNGVLNYYRNTTPTAAAVAFAENTAIAAGTVAATFSYSDDALGTETVTLSGADAALFEVVGNQVRWLSNTTPNFEAKPSYNVTVNIDDPTLGSGPDLSQSFSIGVTDVNEAPTDITLTGLSVNENVVNGTIVGAASAADLDAGTVFTYQLLNNAGGRFGIDAGTGQISFLSGLMLDFESSASHDVTVRATDAGGLFVDRTFSISVNDMPEGGWVGTDANEDRSFGQPGDVSPWAADGRGGNDTITGSLRNDFIDGGVGADSIAGGAGNDTLDGGLGNDTIDGGVGADSMSGGDGIDTLSYASATSGAGILFYMLAANLNGGDAAGDIYSLFENVTGTSVNDRIYMDNGANSVEGGGGFDTVELYAGNDSYLGGSGFDYVLAGAGNDIINVGDGGSLIYGEGDDDSITGASGSNEFNGGLGNDTLTGGTGQDVILGGAGLDSILGGSGDDFLFGEDGNDTVLGDAGNDQIQGGIGLDSLSGGANVDVIQGGADADSIDGGSESDFVFGEAGNDTVLGGAGNDQVFGGTENDSLVGNAGIDILNGGDGNDTLNDGGTLELTFSIGGNGNDTIIGTNGQDQMWGGTGSLDTGSDVFQFGAGNGFDIIFDFQAGPGVVDQIRLLGTGIASFAQLQAENRIGQAGANTQINLPGSGNVIFLMNTTAATLVADDFLFA